MITGITIENFKGIRERVKLDFRPITLLFGANSAGKSTVIHALHYLHEVFFRQNLNPDKTLDGGEQIDLGGFAGLVHGGRTDRDIVLGVQVNSKQVNWPKLDMSEISEDVRLVWEDIFNSPDEFNVEVRIGWSEIDNGPYVRSCEFVFDGTAIAKTEYQPGRTTFDWKLNVRHPSFAMLADNDVIRNHAGIVFDESRANVSSIEALLGGGSDENMHEPTGEVWYETQQEGKSAWPESIFGIPVTLMIDSVADNYVVGNYIEKLLDDTLFRVFRAPIEIVCKELSRFLYIGPLRQLAERVHQPPRLASRSRWANGLAGWDELSRGGDPLVRNASRWLEDVDCLNAGYGIDVKQTIELDLANPLIRRLYDGRAFDDIDGDEQLSLSSLPVKRQLVIVNAEGREMTPHDVGIGISQVLPVIVAAIGRKEHLIAVEQPELHLHPRLQAALGDLFIEAFHEHQNCFIIETHSEHLILRLLRRIRETEIGKVPNNRRLRTDDLGIYYLKQEGGTTRASRIDVDVKGEFIQPWPDDFFEIDFFERFPDAR